MGPTQELLCHCSDGNGNELVSGSVTLRLALGGGDLLPTPARTPIAHVFGVPFDEQPARFDLVAHQLVK